MRRLSHLLKFLSKLPDYTGETPAGLEGMIHLPWVIYRKDVTDNLWYEVQSLPSFGSVVLSSDFPILRYWLLDWMQQLYISGSSLRLIHEIFCQFLLIRDMKFTQISARPLILNSISSTYVSLTRTLEVHIKTHMKWKQLAMCSTVFYYSSISCSGMNDWMHCKLYLISNTTEMLYFLGSYGATIL